MIQSVGPMEAALSFVIIFAVGGILALVLATIVIALRFVLQLFGFEVHE